MTEETTKPRRRRRRRKRPQGGEGAAPEQQPQDNGQGSGEGAGRSRRRRRRGRKPSTGTAPGVAALPADGPVPATAEGVLWIKANGTGVLVSTANNYVSRAGDPIVPRNLIERYRLEAGLRLAGPARRGGNSIELADVDTVEALPVTDFHENRMPFSELISIDPLEQFKLETDSDRLTTRVIDLLSPSARGSAASSSPRRKPARRRSSRTSPTGSRRITPT
jgi:transcription termination factor Rho